MCRKTHQRTLDISNASCCSSIELQLLLLRWSEAMTIQSMFELQSSWVTKRDGCSIAIESGGNKYV